MDMRGDGADPDWFVLASLDFHLWDGCSLCPLTWLLAMYTINLVVVKEVW